MNVPIHAIAFSDDEMMSMKNIDMLHSQFSSANITRQTVNPKDVGHKRIGHIGWHKERYQSMWGTSIQAAAHWLTSYCQDIQ
ncbi:hypothetical protein P4S73_09200 [Paraglaciecola sp. Hal342]